MPWPPMPAEMGPPGPPPALSPTPLASGAPGFALWGLRTVSSTDKIMHAAFRLGDTTVMASDGRCSGRPEFKGVTLSITTESEDEARRMFEALSDGGQPFMPLQQTFFSPAFGMAQDRFGLNWMVMCSHEGQG